MQTITLNDLPKNKYNCVIWNVKNQKEAISVGGNKYCKHQFEKNGICSFCGAYHGKIVDMPYQQYQQKIITELATSPSDITILMANRQVGLEVKLKSILATPIYKEYIWVDKYGAFGADSKQQVLFVYVSSRLGKNILGSSRVICVQKLFDRRLLNFGKTCVVNPLDEWKKQYKGLADFID